MNKKHNLYIGVGLFLIIASVSAIVLNIYKTQEQPLPLIPPKPPPVVQIQKPDLTKIIKTKQPKLDPSTAKEIAIAVEKYCKKYNLPAELVICLIQKESSFNPLVVSKANCVGLMQINTKFHKEKLKKLNIKGNEIFFIDNNIHIGVMILREYLDSTKSIAGALSKYLGIKNKGYLLDVLTGFADLIIIQNEK